MRELFRFIHHISKIGGAGGGKRVFYALLHIVAVVLAFAAGYGAYWLFANFSDLLSQNLLIILIFIPGVIVCVGAAILFFLQGAVAQVILIVFAAIGIKERPSRAPPASAARSGPQNGITHPQQGRARSLSRGRRRTGRSAAALFTFAERAAGPFIPCRRRNARRGRRNARLRGRRRSARPRGRGANRRRPRRSAARPAKRPPRPRPQGP